MGKWRVCFFISLSVYDLGWVDRHCVLLVELDFQPAVLFSPRFGTWKREWGSRVFESKRWYTAVFFISLLFGLGWVGLGREGLVNCRTRNKKGMLLEVRKDSDYTMFFSNAYWASKMPRQIGNPREPWPSPLPVQKEPPRAFMSDSSKFRVPHAPSRQLHVAGLRAAVPKAWKNLYRFPFFGNIGGK